MTGFKKLLTKKSGGFVMGSKIIGKKREDVLTISSKSRQKALPMSKLWLLLQSERCLQREVSSQRRSLLHRREKRQQKIKLNSSAVPSRFTSLTADVSRQLSRDSQLYGKNQFSIRYQKTGTDHTLTVSPAMIRGEPILSISALKVPLCRQRYLRPCPLFLSHTVPTVKKAEKETRMISVHGSKTVLTGVVASCAALALVLGSICLERRMKLKLYEKEMSVVVAEMAEKNQKEISGSTGAGNRTSGVVR